MESEDPAPWLEATVMEMYNPVRGLVVEIKDLECAIGW
jgi:hypothetical protein